MAFGQLTFPAKYCPVPSGNVIIATRAAKSTVKRIGRLPKSATNTRFLRLNIATRRLSHTKAAEKRPQIALERFEMTETSQPTWTGHLLA